MPDYYIDAVSGNDANPGTFASPWKTISKALTAPAGSTVGAQTGNYGALTETTPAGRGDFLTIEALVGATPVLTTVAVDYAAPADAYLRLDGWDITSQPAGQVVNLDYANRVEILNSEIHATKWAISRSGVDGLRIVNCDDVLLEHNHIHEITRGGSMTSCARPIWRRNYVQAKQGTGIQIAGGNVDTVVEYNHVTGEVYDPNDPDALLLPHASIISIRSNDVTIRGNHLHGMGTTSGMMTYTPDAAGGQSNYERITIENNAVYDTDSGYCMRFYNLGSDILVRNNLFHSRYRREGTLCADGVIKDSLTRYSTPFAVHSIGSSGSWAGLTFANNIVVGALSVSSAAIERNNIIWSWGGMSTSPSGTSYIITSRSYGCGTHSQYFENQAFATDPDWSFPTLTPQDWTLKPGSHAIAFPGDISLQPTESLGSIGPDGFVVDDGPARTECVGVVGPVVTPQAIVSSGIDVVGVFDG